MLKLKKLSVQASDEEDEPGQIFQEVSPQWNYFIVTLVESLFSLHSSFPQSSTPVKETRIWLASVMLHLYLPEFFTCWQHKTSLVSCRVETSLQLSARVRVMRKRKVIWMKKINQQNGYLCNSKRLYSAYFQVHTVTLIYVHRF